MIQCKPWPFIERPSEYVIPFLPNNLNVRAENKVHLHARTLSTYRAWSANLTINPQETLPRLQATADWAGARTPATAQAKLESWKNWKIPFIFIVLKRGEDKVLTISKWVIWVNCWRDRIWRIKDFWALWDWFQHFEVKNCDLNLQAPQNYGPNHPWRN